MPLDRDSSNELLNEILREIVTERGRDQSEGLTLRSLERRLATHSEHDDRVYDRLEERVRTLENQAARAEGHDDMRTPGQFQPMPVAINLGNGLRSKRPSFPAMPGWLKTALKPAAYFVAMVLIALATHALSRCSGVAGNPVVGNPVAGNPVPPAAVTR